MAKKIYVFKLIGKKILYFKNKKDKEILGKIELSNYSAIEYKNIGKTKKFCLVLLPSKPYQKITFCLNNQSINSWYSFLNKIIKKKENPQIQVKKLLFNIRKRKRREKKKQT